MEKRINPIDEKVEKVTDTLTTSKTVLNLLYVISILGLLTGIAFSIAALNELNEIMNEGADTKIFVLALTVGIIVPSYFLMQWTRSKKKVLDR